MPGGVRACVTGLTRDWQLQDVILSERRFQYEAEVSTNPLNYDAWFDYVRLEEAAGNPDRVRAWHAHASAFLTFDCAGMAAHPNTLPFMSGRRPRNLA